MFWGLPGGSIDKRVLASIVFQLFRHSWRFSANRITVTISNNDAVSWSKNKESYRVQLVDSIMRIRATSTLPDAGRVACVGTWLTKRNDRLGQTINPRTAD